MHTIDVQESDAQLLGLLSQIEAGDSVILSRNGTPVARISGIEELPALDPRRVSGIGFLRGKVSIPEDIKTPFAEEIEEMFHGNPQKFDSVFRNNDK